MLEALLSGVTGPEQLAELSMARMRQKIPQLREALASRFTIEHHGVMVAQLLAHIDTLDTALQNLTERIELALAPHAHIVGGQLHDQAAAESVGCNPAVGVIGSALVRCPSLCHRDMGFAADERSATSSGPAPARSSRRSSATWARKCAISRSMVRSSAMGSQNRSGFRRSS
jgi:hypothetical protein